MPLEFWIDANLTHKMVGWIESTFGHDAYSIHFLNLLQHSDEQIFILARQKPNVIIITKDEDFANLVEKMGAPPKVIWITTGNCTNEVLKEIIISKFSEVLEILQFADLVELTYS